MKRNSFYLAIAITFLLGILFTAVWFFKPDFLSSRSNQVSDKSYEEVTDESYAVYSVLLSQITSSPENGEKVTLFVINENTGFDRTREIPKKEKLPFIALNVPAEFETSLRDCKVKNKESEKLTRLFDLRQDYILINRADFQAIFKGGNPEKGWDSFYQKYPHSAGFITFSKVGFDAEKKHAIVYWELRCGGLCAEESYFLLTKESDGWKVTEKKYIGAA
jgi:hypothetical protein